MGNITFITADVTKITFQPNQFDLIFSNCLLQYMDDTELPRVVENILRWVNVDGHFFFREVSHLTPGLHDTFKNEEPCICRSTDIYNGLFNNVSIPVDGTEDEVYKFSLVAMNQVQCVKEAFSVEKDFYWIYKKIRCQRSDMSG
ncbi:uncharacterized protein [Ptychodera flava]|uniref:uncharacterized protein n=1 Tax=Ptychodera flava TaxID=63121 RepID=UPI00396A91D8